MIRKAFTIKILVITHAWPHVAQVFSGFFFFYSNIGMIFLDWNIYKCTIQIYQSGVSSTIFKKSAWDLDFPGENRDVRGILRNLIGCLEQLGTRKYIFFTEKQNLGFGVYFCNSISQPLKNFTLILIKSRRFNILKRFPWRKKRHSFGGIHTTYLFVQNYKIFKAINFPKG